MGATCSQECSACITPAVVDNNVDTSMAKVFSEGYSDISVDEHLLQRGEEARSPYVIQSSGSEAKVGEQPVELPRLMLRRPGDTFREHVAMAKVAAWSSEKTSRSDVSATTSECNTPVFIVGHASPRFSPHMPSLSEHPSSALEIVFDVNGEEAMCSVCRRPLDAEISKKPSQPTKVGKVEPGSYAWELGMREGWIIKRIAGEDVTKKSFEETKAALLAGLELLPQALELCIFMQVTGRQSHRIPCLTFALHLIAQTLREIPLKDLPRVSCSFVSVQTASWKGKVLSLQSSSERNST